MEPGSLRRSFVFYANPADGSLDLITARGAALSLLSRRALGAGLAAAPPAAPLSVRAFEGSWSPGADFFSCWFHFNSSSAPWSHSGLDRTVRVI